MAKLIWDLNAGFVAKHYVIARREHVYPFRPYWSCICGHRLQANYMGPALYREFARHDEEKNKL